MYCWGHGVGTFPGCVISLMAALKAISKVKTFSNTLLASGMMMEPLRSTPSTSPVPRARMIIGGGGGTGSEVGTGVGIASGSLKPVATLNSEVATVAWRLLSRGRKDQRDHGNRPTASATFVHHDDTTRLADQTIEVEAIGGLGFRELPGKYGLYVLSQR